MTSSKSYAEFPQYVVKLQSFLSKWEQNNHDDLLFYLIPYLMVFPVMTSLSPLYLPSFSPVITETLRRECEQCEAALKRQLFDFLDGGVFGGEIDDCP